ncbi:YebG family protein [Thiorhodococcus mannitoliphagus]|uniref:YebG family protein n=1 Tax=Thiorhodococcus mannitoliphagus TaxID=329406 RepID=A0A6P1E5S7_9GAMM|nr:YebG family protein [Thiorhodococcus mannitoliphagus]NEX23384.1 YebG family protein [Thiorhodococcus mannitoliphagus]
MIEIEYIVKDSNGVERLRTTDKKAADAYDRALDNAERLAQMIRKDKVLPSLSDTELEELTIYLARNARDVERVLKGKAPERDPTETLAPVPAPATDKIAPIKAAG